MSQELQAARERVALLEREQELTDLRAKLQAQLTDIDAELAELARSKHAQSPT